MWQKKSLTDQKLAASWLNVAAQKHGTKWPYLVGKNVSWQIFSTTF